MLCLVGPSQQVVGSLSPEVTNYMKVHGAILQTLNLSPEAYCRHLRELTFGLNFHPRLSAQKLRAAGLQWLCPAIQSLGQVVEAV